MATLNLQIASGDDDAHEDDSDAQFSAIATFTRFRADLVAGNRWNTGLRFINVTVPQGSTINSAYVSGIFYSATYDDVDIDIHGEAVDDADHFGVGGTEDVTNRTPTAASVHWQGDGLYVDETTWVSSPDIAVPVKEVTDRGGWASGQDLCILILGRTTATKNAMWDSYEHNDTEGAKLDIDYTAAVVGDAFGETGEAVGVTHIQQARVVAY